jgi:putative redox protein
MITTTSSTPPYQVLFSDGIHSSISDTTAEKGGSGSGFRPHDLLEAAVGSCMNMWLQMYAEQHNLPLQTVKTRVSINRADPDKVVFEYEIDFIGDLTEEQHDKLLKVAATCPVRRTLSKEIYFNRLDHENGGKLD